MATSGSMKTETAPPMLKSSILYNQPSLPHLLTEYGFEDKATEKLRKEKEAEKERRKTEKKKQRKKTSSFDDGENEREIEREKQKEEHYLQLIKDMYRLRDYYYHEYSSLLSDKVQKQRRELRERDEERRRQREREEEEEIRASHRVKKRLERHTLDNTPAQIDVPKTDLYYIVGLEDKLRREGKLKTVTDYNKFRNEIQQPHVFYSQFKVPKNTEFEHPPPGSADHLSTHSHGESLDNVLPLSKGDYQPQQQQQFRSLSRISETHESSRPGTRQDGWAVTQRFPAHYKPRKSISGLQPAKPKGDHSQSEIERRFPKLEMPKLHCFNMNLAQKPPDPEQVLQESRLKVREKERKKMMRTVGKMYQLAMSNAAVSNRILDEHEDMDILFQGPDLCDVIADHHWMEAYGLTQVEGDKQQLNNVKVDHQGHGQSPDQEERQEEVEVKGHGSILPEIRSREGSSNGQRSQANSRTSSASFKKISTSEKEESELPALTLNEIEEKCHIMEAKTLSTLWNNYLRAGR